jgi:nuclear pore complex protein Nup155
VYSALEGMFYAGEAPFHGQARRVIGNDLVHLIRRWFNESGRGGTRIFGSDAMANMVSEMLQALQQGGCDAHEAGEARTLGAKIEQLLR